MSKNRLKVSPNERVDIEDFRFLAGEGVQANLRQLVHRFAMEESVVKNQDFTGYILSGFAMSNPSAKQLQVTKGAAILSQRLDGAAVQGIVTTEGDATKIVDLNSYAAGTYGIYIRFEENEGETQGRIFWNPTGLGSEYVASVPTRYVASWSVRVEASSPGAEWLKIGEVAQATMTITDQRPFYFEGAVHSTQPYASGWSTDGDGVANDRNANRSLYGISDLHTFVRAVKQCLEDIKGRGLKRWWDRDIGGMNIGFDANPVSGRLAIGSAAFYLADSLSKIKATLDPSTHNTYDLGSTSYRWRDLYVERAAYVNAEYVRDIQMYPILSVDRADYQQMLSTGLWNDSWGLPSDANNVISGGSTKTYNDLKVIFSSSGEPQLLVFDNTANKFEIWDARSKTLLDTSDAVTDDLPPGISISLESMCTDGVSVYAVIRNITASPDTYYIQAWDLTTWDVKSSWPATGRLLTPTGNAKHFKCIIANATKIAVINNATTVTLSTDPVIEIINMANGTITADGAGDAYSGGSAIADPSIASDGTYLYFSVKDGTNNYFCSASISNPTTGCGGTGFGSTGYAFDANVRASVSIGTKIVHFLNYATYADDQIVITTCDVNAALCDGIYRGQDSQATPLSGESYILQLVGDSVFDGINVWVLVSIDMLSTGSALALLKIDAAKFSYDDLKDKSRSMSDLTSSVFILLPGFNGFKAPQMGLTFDGRDIWAVLEYQTSMTLSGKIARLPLAAFRG